MVPVFLVAIGLAFSKVQFFSSSPDRNLVPDQYMLKQKLMYNNQLLTTSNNDIQPFEIMNNLPDVSEAFDLQMFTNTKINDRNRYSESLVEFDSNLFNVADDELPYRYGSYFILAANNGTKTFKIATLVNTTSQDAVPYFS